MTSQKQLMDGILLPYSWWHVREVGTAAWLEYERSLNVVGGGNLGSRGFEGNEPPVGCLGRLFDPSKCCCRHAGVVELSGRALWITARGDGNWWSVLRSAKGVTRWNVGAGATVLVPGDASCIDPRVAIGVWILLVKLPPMISEELLELEGDVSLVKESLNLRLDVVLSERLPAEYSWPWTWLPLQKDSRSFRVFRVEAPWNAGPSTRNVRCRSCMSTTPMSDVAQMSWV